MEKKGGKRGVTNEKIMAVLLDMDGRLGNIEESMVTKSDLKDYATKADFEKFTEDILEEIRPIARAVDKDAVAIVNHEKRIVSLERKVAFNK